MLSLSLSLSLAKPAAIVVVVVVDVDVVVVVVEVEWGQVEPKELHLQAFLPLRRNPFRHWWWEEGVLMGCG